ncbi:MAG: lipid-transfer protein [Syntrophorhabdus sp. PtaU1.Bin050]|nr:MAG: lipid-transfer protein [Syntrophorhabdus sp. PtaU1.Bin050]
MRDVMVLGMGVHPFGRFDGKSFEDLGQEAVVAALKDAGDMPWTDVQAAFCGTMHGGTGAGHRVLARVGMTGIPIVNLETGCAAGSSAFIMAYRQVAAGICDVTIALGVEKMPRGFMRMTSYPQWQVLSGLALNPLEFSLRASRHMAEYGTTEEQLAKVSVKSHKNGALNPYAMYQKEMSLEQVINSKMVCYPLRVLEFAAPGEGAGAAILCSEEVARKYNRSRAVKVAAACIGVAQYGTSRCGGGIGGMGQSAKIHNEEVATKLSKQAYEISGIGPEDLDLVELQDTDSSSEIILYEQFGLCPIGEGGRLIDEGRTELSGDIPVNPSGGLLSCSEPTGASALRQLAEVTWHLRGEAGKRQIPNAKAGMAQASGAGGNCTVIILKK